MPLYPLSYARLRPGGGIRTRDLPIRSRSNPNLRIRPVDLGRPVDQAAKDTSHASFVDEARCVRAAGLSPATVRSHDPKEPSPAQQADHSILKELNCQASPRCEARARTWTSCFRGRRGPVSTTSHRSGRGGSNSQPPASDAGALPVAPRPVVPDEVVRRRADGGSRTHTDGGLSAVPLPRLGYVSERGPSGGRTRNHLLAGEPRFQLRHRPMSRSLRGRGSNPLEKAYGTFRLPESPLWGDQPDSNRLSPGPRPGVSSACDLGHRRRGGSRTPTTSV